MAMAITYEVSEDGSFVHTKVSGEVTEQDLECHDTALASDRRVRPEFRELFDATAGTAVGLTEATFSKLAEIGKAHLDKFQGARCAIVVQRSREFELAKLFEEAYDGPTTIIIFYNLDVAKTWLGCKTEPEARDPLSQ